MDIPKTTVVVMREGLVQSVVADVITFGSLIGMFAANYYYLGNQAWSGILLSIMALMYVAGFKKSNKFTSYDEAIAYLKQEKKVNASSRVQVRGEVE